MKVRFVGAVQDSSGYGEFSRYFIHSLNEGGHEVFVEPILLPGSSPLDFGKKGALCKKLVKRVRRPDVNVINMIPLFFKRYRLSGVPNIGFTMWETSHVPDSWVEMCNDMDAILVPCSWNKKVFEDSGVSVPVHVVYPGMDIDDIPSASDITEKKKDKFHFYSIFQWHERKNPLGLLRAYFAEFHGCDDVSLLLKTYRHKNSNGITNEELISREIKKLKGDLKLSHYPEVKCITKFISNDAIADIHRRNHCFVLPHRSEGWGMPHMDAMSYGNPCISTNFSGNTDFMKPDNSYMIPYQLAPACGMSGFIPWYNGTMYWAEPDLFTLAKKMREVFENRHDAFKVGKKGRDFIMINFNTKTSEKMFIAACLKVIEGKR